MKKHEKILTAIFVTGILAFVIALLYRVFFEHVILDYIVFNDPFLIFCGILIVSVIGIIPLLLNIRMRKRRERGMNAISNLYTTSFAVSLFPYILIILDCTAKAVFGYTSFGRILYGLEAIQNRLLFIWFYVFCCIFPILPLLAYWQFIYIISLIRTKVATKRS